MARRLLLFVSVFAAVGAGVLGVSGAVGAAAPVGRGEIVFTRTAREGARPSLYVMSVDGSRLRLFVRDAAEAAGSRDGRWIAFVRGDAIWVMGRDGSGQRQLTKPSVRTKRAGQVWAIDSSPAWSADGRAVYFARAEFKNDTATTYYSRPGPIYSIRKDGSGLHQLTHPRLVGDIADHAHPAPSPDGRLVAYQDEQDLHGLGWTIAAVTTAGHPAKLPFQFPAGRSSSAYDPAWAPNGRVLAYVFMDMEYAGGGGGSDRSGLYMSSSDRSRPRRISQWMGAPAWSSDGMWIASSGGGILTMRSDGTQVRTLTHKESDADPVWLRHA